MSTRHRELFILDKKNYWALQNGYLECEECGEYWCTHISGIVKRNADSETIWADNAEAAEVQTVQVPIVPTAAQWAECLLTFNPKVGAYKVTYKTSFIGFVHKGEARMVMRSMLVDWFKGLGSITPPRCTSPTHTFEAQQRWEKDLKHETKAFIQQWSVTNTGKCLVCSPGYNSDTFSDLIPKDEKESPWNK